MSRMVDLAKDTLDICGGKHYLVKLFQKNLWQQRDVNIKWLNGYRVISYHSFEALVLSVFPYEDKQELFRFWNGYHPSEYIISKISELTSIISSINLKPFQC